jgi:hypothetical protein
MKHSAERETVLYLKNRLGLCRLAAEFTPTIINNPSITTTTPANSDGSATDTNIDTTTTPTTAVEEEKGLAIIPCYCFNQRPAFSYFVPQWRWLHKLGRKIGFIPLCMFGYFHLPFAPPKPVPLVLVMGKPIFVPKIPNSDLQREKKLQEIQNQLVIAIQQIWDKYGKEFDARFQDEESQKGNLPTLKIL